MPKSTFAELSREIKEEPISFFSRVVSGLIALALLCFAYGLILMFPVFRIWPRWLWLKKKP